MLKLFNKLLLFSAFIALVLSSCTPQKKLTYFQDQEGDSTIFYPVSDFLLTIEKKDILTLQLFTVNPEAVPGLATTMDERVVDNRTFYEKGFVVDENGKLDLPLIGKVKLSGLSIEVAKDTIENRYRKFIEEPLVVLKKLSFKFTVLGEVIKPGVYYANGEKLTIAEALGMAGDLNYYGSRKDVKIFRQTDDKVEQIMLDLTTKEAVTSNKMFVHSNDVIYIRAIRRKATAATLPAVQVFTSIITTFTVLATFFLIKAQN